MHKNINDHTKEFLHFAFATYSFCKMQTCQEPRCAANDHRKIPDFVTTLLPFHHCSPKPISSYDCTCSATVVKPQTKHLSPECTPKAERQHLLYV